MHCLLSFTSLARQPLLSLLCLTHYLIIDDSVFSLDVPILLSHPFHHLSINSTLHYRQAMVLVACKLVSAVLLLVLSSSAFSQGLFTHLRTNQQSIESSEFLTLCKAARSMPSSDVSSRVLS
jgi:hypothetical protein